MGVHGLWKLLEPSGQVVPLEGLAGKVLAVDVSIWLHQAVKGMHDAHGAPLAVAHLLILFHRVCKLLFYKIKPVFVFDGGVPALKQQTMAVRRQRSTAAKTEAVKVREKLIKNLLKHEAVRHMLSDEAASAALGLNSFTLPGPSVEEDLYKLPPIAADCAGSESDEAVSSNDEDTEKHADDIHSIDVTSQEFLSLPAEVRHGILTELIETRKQSSWKHLDSMPKKSDSFSDFQMNRLLKRHTVQTSLEKAGKEMGGRALSLKELESLLGDQGVLDPNTDLPGNRIAQDSVTRFMLIQKDSEDVPEQEKTEKFNIMENLGDVEWSSESDTDIILEKSPERQKRLNEIKSVSNKIQPVEKLAVTNDKATEKNNDYCSVSKQPTVRMTQEVEDILLVLEDKNANADVKVWVESLQSRINFNKDIKTKEEETNQTKSNLNKNLNPENSVPLEIDNIILSNRVPNFEDKKHEVRREKVIEIKNTESPKEVDSKIEKVQPLPEPKTTAEELVGVANIELNADSSSDSENDFIPITTKEAEFILDSVIEKTTIKPTEVPAATSDPLTVVINPSDLSHKDDLFADVFESKNRGDGMVETDVEEEKRKESDNFEEYDTEFKEQVSAGNLEDLRKNLEEQHSDFLKERGKQERLAMNMTDQVYTDAQELLRLFGIPFVIAPMEAEAQCATLNLMGLTEGTITDDSDIWLFGGQVVYKNFFNQQKHVLEYRFETIHKCFKLTREDMIKMAMLVGSDYTVGLTGIGPVTALEIIAAFQNPNQGLLDSLQKFRDWFMGSAAGGPPRVTLRKKIKNTIMAPGFPNRAVVEAYLQPQVDDSKEPFSWAKPNLDLIQKYVRAKLGWSPDKCNELLQPVLKKLNESSNQTTIDRHFKFFQKSTSVDGMLSKRVENAVKRLGGNSLESDEPEEEVKPKKRRKPNTRVEDSSQNEEKTEEILKFSAEPKTSGSSESGTSTRKLSVVGNSKIKLINQKLHQDIKVPQREMAQKKLEEKKKEAVRIFRTFKKGGKKKTKVYAKEQVKLSESSSDDD